MAVTTGNKAVFKLDNSGGVLTDLSPYIKEVKITRETAIHDTTVINTSNKSYVPGLNDAKITISGPFDPTLHTHMTGVIGNTSLSFEYGPAGAGAGSPKMSGECILMSYEPGSPVEDLNNWTATLQVTGAVTDGTY